MGAASRTNSGSSPHRERIRNTDETYWNGSNIGELTTKFAFERYREKEIIIPWMKYVWRRFTHPKISIFIWKLVQNKVAVAQNLTKRGMQIAEV